MAMFSLARKLAPSIIFIDEIDTLLFNRNGSTHHLYSSTHGVFLSEWDGLSSSPNAAPVVILGATNRPQDIDDAFRRRMPVSIETRTPTTEGRRDILEKMLSNEHLDETVSLEEVAICSEGFSGSDLRELVRAVNTVRAKEMIESFKDFQKSGSKGHFHSTPRPLCMNDFHSALSKLRKAEDVIEEFVGDASENGSKVNLAEFVNLLMKWNAQRNESSE